MSRDDRRLSPRTRLTLPVKVTTNQGTSCDSTSVNLSLAGLQIACDPWAATIVAGDAQVLQMTPGRTLQLTIGDTTGIAATTLWVRRESQNEFHFGLQFDALAEQTLNQIAALLAHTRGA